MANEKPWAKIEPLVIGRVTRILFGIAAFAFIAVVGVQALGVVVTGLLGVLGASFILGAIMRNPGCEITAIPNLFLPRQKKVHCI
ncbi:MAG: hypothetical protein ACE5E0_06515 [Terriglobia bacterium]